LWRVEQLIPLRSKPFAILQYLILHPQQLIKKEELLTQLWGTVYVSEAVRRMSARFGKRWTILPSRHASSRPRMAEDMACFIATVERTLPTSTLAPASPWPHDSTRANAPSSNRVACVGRGAELGRLRDAFEKALHQSCQIVFVTGEAGIGKTLLIKTFLEQMPPNAGVWMALRAVPERMLRELAEAMETLAQEPPSYFGWRTCTGWTHRHSI
jgi:hypothetical protein